VQHKEKLPSSGNSTFQKGNPQIPENYRPIANLNHPEKKYKKLILEMLWSTNGNSLLSNHQYGFGPQYGTNTATTTMFALVNELIESKKKLILIILDISAVFNILGKFILITKLRAHGPPERINAIFNDFLSNRKANVQVIESVSGLCARESIWTNTNFFLFNHNIFYMYLHT
jgi:hypothetical protein